MWISWNIWFWTCEFLDKVWTFAPVWRTLHLQGSLFDTWTKIKKKVKRDMNQMLHWYKLISHLFFYIDLFLKNAKIRSQSPWKLYKKSAFETRHWKKIELWGTFCIGEHNLEKCTLFENYSKCLIWILAFWHFPPFFVLLKLTCLVTLFGWQILLWNL